MQKFKNSYRQFWRTPGKRTNRQTVFSLDLYLWVQKIKLCSYQVMAPFNNLFVAKTNNNSKPVIDVCCCKRGTVFRSFAFNVVPLFAMNDVIPFTCWVSKNDAVLVVSLVESCNELWLWYSESTGDCDKSAVVSCIGAVDGLYISVTGISSPESLPENYKQLFYKIIESTA